jgi:hypothetical protein
VVRTADDRRVRVLAAASAVILFALILLSTAAPAPAPRINVRWAASLPDEGRRELERRFGLVTAEHQDGRTWTYEAADASPETMRTLIAHPAVEDTHGVDRRTGAIPADTPRGAIRSGPRLWQWVDSRPARWITIWSGWSALLAAIWLLRRSATRETSRNAAPSIPPAR